MLEQCHPTNFNIWTCGYVLLLRSTAMDPESSAQRTVCHLVQSQLVAGRPCVEVYLFYNFAFIDHSLREIRSVVRCHGPDTENNR